MAKRDYLAFGVIYCLVDITGTLHYVTSHYINYDYANDHETSEGRPELCHSCTEMTPKFGINNQILSQKSLKLGL